MSTQEQILTLAYIDSRMDLLDTTVQRIPQDHPQRHAIDTYFTEAWAAQVKATEACKYGRPENIIQFHLNHCNVKINECLTAYLDGQGRVNT